MEFSKEFLTPSEEKDPFREIDGFRLTDADTILRTGDDKKFRASNLSAPETAHIKSGIYIPGQIGGEETHRGMADLVEQMGTIPIGDTTGAKSYKREMAPFTAADIAYRTGILRPDQYSSPEAIRASTEGFVARSLLPETAAADPYQQIGQRTRQAIANAARQEGVPLYTTPAEFQDEAQRASYNRYRSNIAINEDSQLINDYQKEIDSGKLDDAQSKEYQQRINILRAQTFSRAMRPDIAGSTVTFRSKDRSLDNQAYDQMATTWDRTWKEFNTGIIDLVGAVGRENGWKALQQSADAWAWNRKYDTSKMAATISSYKDVTEAKGFWNTTGTAMQYLGNLASQTAVYATASGLSFLAGGPISAFALGATPMFLSTAGQIYDTQPENKKNLGMALATSAVISSLEQLGLQTMFRGTNGMLKINAADAFLTKEGRDAMVKYMVNVSKVAPTETAALEMIENATKRGLTNFAQNTAEFASQQNTIIKNIARVGKDTGLGIAEEGSTEYFQEMAQIYGETGDWGKYKEPLDLQYRDRLREAGIGGAAMGGGIGVVRGAHSALQWWGIEDLHRPADPAKQADYAAFRGMQQLKQNTSEQFRHTTTDQALANYTDQKASTTFDGHNIGDSKLETIAGSKQGELFTRIKEIIKDPISFFRGQAGSALRSARNDDGSMRLHIPSIWSLLSDKGFLAGAHEERYEKDLRARWTHGLNLSDLAAELGTNEKTAAAIIKDVLDNGAPPDLHPAIKNWFSNIERARRDMLLEMTDARVNTDQLLDFKTMLNSLVGREDIKEALLKSSKQIADELSVESGRAPITNQAGKILNTENNIRKLLNDFSSPNRTISAAASTDLQRIGAINSPTFIKASDYNIVDNINKFMHNKAKEVSLAKYYGKDGEVIGNALLHAYHAGEITANQTREAAYIINRMLQQRKGEYYDMSEYKTINTMMSLSTTGMLGALLGKVALTSQIEVAMASLGIPSDKLESYMTQYLGALKDNLKEDLNWVKVQTAASVGLTVARQTANAQIIAKAEKANEILSNPAAHTQKELEEAQQLLEDVLIKAQPRQLANALGFIHGSSAFNQQVESDVRSKLSDINRKMMALFQLNNVTDATRIAVLAALPDMMREKLRVLSLIPKNVREQQLISGRGLNKEQAEAYRELTQAGLDVFGHLDYLENNNNTPMDYSDLIMEQHINENLDAPSQKEMLRRNMMTAISNIVSKHVVDPEVQNTPIGFGNPWLRPLTTLKRFVWASYNTFIPRLYKDFIKDGNVSMRYDAFVTMAMMYIMSSMTNSMKDLISWGDADKHEKKLGFYKKIQRNIYSTGLLGQFGPAADTIAPVFGAPMYGLLQGKKGEGPSVLQIANNIAKEHSPMYGYVAGPAGAVADLAQGKPAEAAKAVLRATPANISPGAINALIEKMK